MIGELVKVKSKKLKNPYFAIVKNEAKDTETKEVTRLTVIKPKGNNLVVTTIDADEVLQKEFTVSKVIPIPVRIILDYSSSDIQKEAFESENKDYILHFIKTYGTD